MSDKEEKISSKYMVHARFPKELHKRFKMLAVEEERSMNWLLVKLVENHLDSKEDKK